MLNRQRQQYDPKVDIARRAGRASLAIAWGIAAGVAYLGLIYQAVQLIANATNGQWSAGTIDQGIIHAGTTFKEFGASYAQLATIVVAALPVAIIATVVLGVIARARPRTPAIPGLLIASGVLGLVASLLLFVALVANLKNGVQFIVALLTIVIVSVLLRLQRGVRRFFRRSPAIASLLFAGVTIFYLIISNGANISSLVLQQVDVWLSLLAFAIVIYCGVTLIRIGQRLRASGFARPGGKR